MRLIVTLLFLGISSFAWAGPSRIKAPIVSGKLQPSANCIQCGGRFICGHTDQVVRLKYQQNYESARVGAHCARKSREISESIRVNGAPRTEEAVRYQDYFASVVEVIQNQKGGQLRYKVEKGFPLRDFVRYTGQVSGKKGSELKQQKKQNLANLRSMQKDNLVLPVVSLSEFKMYQGENTGIKLEASYREYVKDLLVLHPSELAETPQGSAIYRKSFEVNARLKKSLGDRFAGRAVGGANLAAGGGAKGGKARAPGKADAQKRGVAKVDPIKALSEKVMYDDFGNVVNDKVIKQKQREQDQKDSQELLMKTLSDDATKRANTRSMNKSNKSKNYSYNRPGNTSSSAMAEIFKTSGDSICSNGNTKAAGNYAQKASSSITSKWGADDSLTNSLIGEDLNNRIRSALNRPRENCFEEIRSIFTSEEINLAKGATAEALQIQAAVDGETYRPDTIKAEEPDTRMVAAAETPSGSAGSSQQGLSAGDSADNAIADASQALEGTQTKLVGNGVNSAYIADLRNDTVKNGESGSGGLRHRVSNTGTESIVGASTATLVDVDGVSMVGFGGVPTKPINESDRNESGDSSITATCDNPYEFFVRKSINGAPACSTKAEIVACRERAVEYSQTHKCSSSTYKDLPCEELYTPKSLQLSKLLSGRTVAERFEQSIGLGEINSPARVLLDAQVHDGIRTLKAEAKFMATIYRLPKVKKCKGIRKVFFEKTEKSKVVSSQLTRHLGKDLTPKLNFIGRAGLQRCKSLLSSFKKYEADLEARQAALSKLKNHFAKTLYPMRYPYLPEEISDSRSRIMAKITDEDLAKFIEHLSLELILESQNDAQEQVYGDLYPFLGLAEKTNQNCNPDNQRNPTSETQ